MTIFVPLISIQMLRETLDAMVVLDVRSEADWRESRFKIPGALREVPGDEHRWMEKYPKDRRYVLYCS